MTATKVKRAPRQLPAQREQDLLDAAQALFFEKGVAATTTDEISKKAGISKATLYRRYKDKRVIFEKIILDNTHRLAGELASIELNAAQPRDSLRQAALNIRQSMTRSHFVDLVRQIIAEAHTQPELSRQAQKLIAAKAMVHQYLVQAATTFALMAGDGFRPLLNAQLDAEQELARLEADLEMFFVGYQIQV